MGLSFKISTEHFRPISLFSVESVTRSEVVTSDEWYNVERLARAIGQHETHMGADRTDNNVCGIRRNNRFETYSSVDEALQDCMSVVEKYRPWTITQMSKRWTTTQQFEWANNVNHFYKESI